MAPPGAAGDWQLACAQWKQRGAYLLRSGLWADCTFLAGEERKPIPTHKLLLAAASPVFEAMLFGTMVPQEEIAVPDILPDTFTALLEYLYTDKVDLSSFNLCFDLYYTAQKYMLPFLAKDCAFHLLNKLTPENACRVYEIACLFNEDLLIQGSEKIIRTKTTEVLNASSFEEAELSTVVNIFSWEPLNIDSELDLFNALERYAKCDKSKSQEPKSIKLKSIVVEVQASIKKTENKDEDSFTPSSSDELEQPRTSTKKADKVSSNTSQQDLTIRNAIKHIRFLTISSKEFAEGPAKSSLLTKDEILAIILNIASTSSEMKMPLGFSTNREQRRTKDEVRSEKDKKRHHKQSKSKNKSKSKSESRNKKSHKETKRRRISFSSSTTSSTSSDSSDVLDYY